MKVSRRWIIWAHEAPAEAGIASSEDLLDLAYGPGRGRVEVPANLLHELVSVAELYGPETDLDEMGPWWIGEQRRIVREGRVLLKKRRSASRRL